MLPGKWIGRWPGPHAPIMGTSKISDSVDSKVAIARTVADLICSVTHQIRPNEATALPIKEKVCPVQLVKNRDNHFNVSQDMVRFGIVVIRI